MAQAVKLTVNGRSHELTVDDPDMLPDQAQLHDYLRARPALARKEEVRVGDVDAAMADAARTVAATYE